MENHTHKHWLSTHPQRISSMQPIGIKNSIQRTQKCATKLLHNSLHGRVGKKFNRKNSMRILNLKPENRDHLYTEERIINIHSESLRSTKGNVKDLFTRRTDRRTHHQNGLQNLYSKQIAILERTNITLL